MQKKGLLKIYIIIFSFLFIFSCNKDYYSVGIEIFDEQFDDLKTKTFPVFSYQQSLDKVQTNNISSVQLGTFSDDFFGRTNSSFISQLDVFSLQSFGDFNQDQENEGSLTDIRVINEQEQLTGVYLDLPFFNSTNDTDGDGVISFDDLKAVATELGEDMTDEELREMIAGGNKGDKDGVVH